MCGEPMRKNGRTAAGSQRWQCDACRLDSTAVRRDVEERAALHAFLGWLLGGRAQWDMASTEARVQEAGGLVPGSAALASRARSEASHVDGERDLPAS